MIDRDCRALGEPGADQVQSADAGPNYAEPVGGRRGRNLARWFWATIVMLAVISLGLSLLAIRHSISQDTVSADQDGAGEQTEPEVVLVDEIFREAGEEAKKIKGRIDPLLSEAYKPVYAGIPAYMDFHYSLKGEWLELGSAALGEMGSGLDRYLFAGLDTRLDGIADTLVRDYDDRYGSALDEAMTEVPGGTGVLGPVATRAINDAQARVTTTAGTFAGTAIGGLSLKALTKVFAQKLATNLVGKVAAKTGAKWMAAAGGAGTGALACSWAGPLAAGCAVGGAVITWIGVDLAVIKLDEYVTREDFERDLRHLIDKHQEEARGALEGMLELKVRATDSERKKVVRDVYLYELSDFDRNAACQAAADILTRYDAIRGNLEARSPANIEAVRENLTSRANNYLLAPWVERMEAAIANKDFRPWVDDEVSLTVDLPPDHEIRATLLIGQTKLEFDWTGGDSAGHFDLSPRPEEKIILEWPQRIQLALVQDRGMFRPNRSFTGSTRFDYSESLAKRSGLTPKPKIMLSMLSDNMEGSSPRARLELPMAGVPLSGQKIPEFCAK